MTFLERGRTGTAPDIEREREPSGSRRLAGGRRGDGLPRARGIPGACMRVCGAARNSRLFLLTRVCNSRSRNLQPQGEPSSVHHGAQIKVNPFLSEVSVSLATSDYCGMVGCAEAPEIVPEGPGYRC